jgi:hypothetical protein
LTEEEREKRREKKRYARKKKWADMKKKKKNQYLVTEKLSENDRVSAQIGAKGYTSIHVW